MGEQEPITFERDGNGREALMACQTYLSGPVDAPVTAILADREYARRATDADLRAAGYVPVAERDALAAQVVAMREALRRILDWMATGERLTPDQAVEMVGHGEAALAFTPTAAEQRVRALEELWSAIKDFDDGQHAFREQGIHFDASVIVRAKERFDKAEHDLRALDGKDGGADA